MNSFYRGFYEDENFLDYGILKKNLVNNLFVSGESSKIVFKRYCVESILKHSVCFFRNLSKNYYISYIQVQFDSLGICILKILLQRRFKTYLYSNNWIFRRKNTLASSHVDRNFYFRLCTFLFQFLCSSSLVSI